MFIHFFRAKDVELFLLLVQANKSSDQKFQINPLSYFSQSSSCLPSPKRTTQASCSQNFSPLEYAEGYIL